MGSVLIWIPASLVLVFVVWVIYGNEGTAFLVEPATEMRDFVDVEVIGVANPAENIELGPFGGEIDRVGLALTQRLCSAKEVKGGLSGQESFLLSTALFSLVWALHGQACGNVGFANNLSDMRGSPSDVCDVKLAAGLRSFLKILGDRVDTTNPL